MEPVGIFLGIYIDLKKEKKTKYHAKIDSKQIKYLEHFKIKIIPCKRK